jgi:hypothetical protein
MVGYDIQNPFVEGAASSHKPLHGYLPATDHSGSGKQPLFFDRHAFYFLTPIKDKIPQPLQYLKKFRSKLRPQVVCQRIFVFMTEESRLLE